MPKLAVGNF